MGIKIAIVGAGSASFGPATLRDVYLSHARNEAGVELAAVPIMEAVSCGVVHALGAVNVPNRGVLPGMDDDCVVELPAVADGRGVRPLQMDRLPEGVTAMLRIQGSIQKLLVEAYAEGSRRKLLQALLLDPTAHSYRNAVALINEMCALQKNLLPRLEW